MDKPGKSPDLYHTCYALSGLSLVQNSLFGEKPVVLGLNENLLLPINPTLNVVTGKAEAMMKWFQDQQL